MTLNEYNKKVYDVLSKKYHHFQIGFFNSSKILFVGQNPGQPFTDAQRSEITKIATYSDFEEREEEYTRQWQESLFGQHVSKIIDGRWDDISFTNAIKIPTIRNSAPSLKSQNAFKIILRRQIELLEPELVVCFGKIAASMCGLGTNGDILYDADSKRLFVEELHPAYVMRQGRQFEENEISHIRQLLTGAPIYFFK